jgi:hypothetical protein
MTATVVAPTASATNPYVDSLLRAARVNWRLEDIIGADRRLDFNRRFLPDLLARVERIGCLNEQEKRILNQIRGNSYLHLFALAEEFILPAVLGQVGEGGLEDITATQALLHFAEEESKHIRLFRRFAEEFSAGFGSPCDVIGPIPQIAAAVLQHGPLGVMFATLLLEWATQHHYLASVQGNDAEDLDPQFCSLLRHHWLEEAQHADLDTLVLQRLARELDGTGLRTGADDFFRIVELLEGGLREQVGLDLTSFTRATGRVLDAAATEEVTSCQRDSYLWTFLGSGLSHPRFQDTFAQVCPEHLPRLREASARYGGAA